MSLKTWLTPKVTARLFAEETLLKRRLKAERKRLREGRPHRVDYFHQASDPYSALLAQILPELVKRYDIELVCHLVPEPDQSAAPEPELLFEHSMRDASLLAKVHYVMKDGFTEKPTSKCLAAAELALCQALVGERFVELAGPISLALWGCKEEPMALQAFPRCTPDTLETAISAGQERREELGHYLGGMMMYEGEWYWGPDRLHYLESRLQSLGLQRKSLAHSPFIFAPLHDTTPIGDPVAPHPTGLQADAAPPVIEFFFSIRSPYSAIVAPRVFALARETGATIAYNFVLPMVMRGLPVPKSKRQYIVQDTAREARHRSVPFGRMNDPVGKPTERVLSIMPLAIREGKAEQWLTEAMLGIWSEGIDAGSDKGLRTLVERAGLDWQAAQAALLDNNWRKQAEANRERLFSLGLWGVPSFKVGDEVFWGQDRLWAVRDAVIKAKHQNNMTNTEQSA